MMEPFRERILQRGRALGSWLVLGLDPDLELLPPQMRGLEPEEALVRFSQGALGAVEDLVVAVKIQMAFFERWGSAGWRALERVVSKARRMELPVILDSKRGDVPSTTKALVSMAFDHLGVDAVTVHPYLGWDSIEPWALRPERGVFVLVRTTNPGSHEIQSLPAAGGKLFERIAQSVAEWDGRCGTLGVVAGATSADDLGRVRSIVGERMPILVPGVGAQGASPKEAARGANALGEMALVSSSRSILFSGSATPKDQRRAALALRDELRREGVGSPRR